MLNAIIRFSLQNRLIVVMLSLATLIYGSYLATGMPIDVFPDLDRPRVVVMTECPGLAAEEVETLVSYPLESSLLGATGVQMVRSQSGPSLSVVYVEFDWAMNVYTARQVVQERLSAITSSLPEGIKPSMGPISSVMGQILRIGVSRKPGPEGGMLFPLARTGYLVELVEHDKRMDIFLWNPRDTGGKRIAQPEQWHTAKADKVVLLWPDQTRQTLEAQSPVHFRGHLNRPLMIDAPIEDERGKRPAEPKLEITLKGQRHEVALSGEKLALELRTLADWVIRPRLLKVPGIAQITAMGGGRKQYQVLLDPEAMFRHGVTLEEIETALRKNNLNTSGGLAERADREMPIRIYGRLGPETAQVLAELPKLPVKQTPERTILIEQLAARVVEGAQFKRGDASINGSPGVLMTVAKQPHVDTRALTTSILDALRDIEQSLPADVEVNANVFQLKNFIDRGVYNAGEALVIGAVLVLIILFVFLLNFRTTFISLTAIPLSLAISALVFRLMGWIAGGELSINVMTLGGLAVAMGELVDDAIVDVENIFRRLRENNARPDPRPVLQVIYEASVEVRGAIVFGTLMVILVFLPLFALSGIEGRLFAPLGVAYIVSILASLLVSLSVTPVLSYYLLPQSRATHRKEDSPLLRLLKWLASGLIRLGLARPGWVLAGSWLLVVLAAWQMTQLGTEFLPPFDEGSVQVNVMLPAGASLGASEKVSAIVDSRFRAMRKSANNPDGLILDFVRKTGRAELDEHVDPVSGTEFILAINPHSGRTREEVLTTIMHELRGDPDQGVDSLLPYASIENEQPLQDLISHMLSGASGHISIKLYGDELDTLRGLAEKIQSTIGDVKGLASVVIESQENVEELQIRLRPRDLAYYGIDREHAARFVQLALQGQVVSQVIDGQRRFDVLVRLDDPYRTDFFSLGRLRLDVPGKGTAVMLSDIADIGTGYSPNYIQRENARRRLVIRCNVLGRDQGSVAGEIQKRIDTRIPLPTGYFVELGGQFQSQREATWRIGLLAAIALAGMFLVLYTLYPSPRIVLQVLNALPTAFIGGVLALLLTQQKVSVAALVGFISLGGIAVRNGILLVSHYFHLMRSEGEAFSPHMILRGSLERLAPVLMTALTAGIALIPLVVGGHQPGREILYPVATVILGGLVTSTLCEFLIHPGLFWAFSGKDAVRLAARGHDDTTGERGLSAPR